MDQADPRDKKIEELSAQVSGMARRINSLIRDLTDIAAAVGADADFGAIAVRLQQLMNLERAIGNLLGTSPHLAYLLTRVTPPVAQSGQE